MFNSLHLCRHICSLSLVADVVVVDVGETVAVTVNSLFCNYSWLAQTIELRLIHFNPGLLEQFDRNRASA